MKKLLLPALAVAAGTAAAAILASVDSAQPRLSMADDRGIAPASMPNAPHAARDPIAAEDVPPRASNPGSYDPNPHASAQGLPDHHSAPHQGGSDVEIGQVRRAEGPLGRTIAEVYAERERLAGKQVRVRGIVVKAVSGVLGRTFAHLRDGTGDAQHATHDLTITTEQALQVGQQVLLEGTLSTDRDYGSGFRYRAVLENSRLVSD